MLNRKNMTVPYANTIGTLEFCKNFVIIPMSFLNLWKSTENLPFNGDLARDCFKIGGPVWSNFKFNAFYNLNQ